VIRLAGEKNSLGGENHLSAKRASKGRRKEAAQACGSKTGISTRTEFKSDKEASGRSEEKKKEASRNGGGEGKQRIAAPRKKKEKAVAAFAAVRVKKKEEGGKKRLHSHATRKKKETILSLVEEREGDILGDGARGKRKSFLRGRKKRVSFVKLGPDDGRVKNQRGRSSEEPGPCGGGDRLAERVKKSWVEKKRSRGSYPHRGSHPEASLEKKKNRDAEKRAFRWGGGGKEWNGGQCDDRDLVLATR